MRLAGGIGAALVLGLATGVAAQDVPSWRDRITFTVNDRVRGEFVDWFTPHEGKAQPEPNGTTSSPTGSAPASACCCRPPS